MSRPLGTALLVLLLPCLCRAQDSAPEQLLPLSTQIYLRWDGIEAHRGDYEKTALGKMMMGDTGKFVTGTFAQLQDSLGALLTVEQLLQGVPPAQLQKIQADAAVAPQILGVLGQHGFVLGAEVSKLEPPSFQITLVVPAAGARSDALFAGLRLIAALEKMEVKETKTADGGTAFYFERGQVNVTWLVQGKHVVVVAGSKPAQGVLTSLTGKDGRLTANPLFKKVQGFKQFTTSARGFVDVAGLARVAASRAEIAKLIDDLGVDALKSLTFYSGFDGEAERGVVELDMPAPRKGLLNLAGGKPFQLKDVPPLPPDVTSWSMTNFDYGNFYDLALHTVESIVGLAAPDDLPKIRAGLKQVEDGLGINIRNDLLGALGDRVVQYNSPAEGPLTLGQTLLLKVKDAKKLQETLDRIVKGLARLTGADITIKKKTYHGVEVREIHVQQQGFIFVPTYALHNDWLVVSYFPQSVQGYLLRATGELSVWKPGPAVLASLDKLPKDFIAVSMSDPTPTVKQILSVAPIIGASVNSFSKDMKFDVGALPNAHEATRHLFPNVAVVSDNGKALRLELRLSLALPLDLTGVDTYAVFIVFGLAFRGF